MSLWVDQYCAANPLNETKEAASALVEALRVKQAGVRRVAVIRPCKIFRSNCRDCGVCRCMRSAQSASRSRTDARRTAWPAITPMTPWPSS